VVAGVNSNKLDNDGLVLVRVNGRVGSEGSLVVLVDDKDGESSFRREGAFIRDTVGDVGIGNIGGVSKLVVRGNIDNTSLDISDGVEGGSIKRDSDQTSGESAGTEGILIELIQVTLASSQILNPGLHNGARVQDISGGTSQVDKGSNG
jgi:hypothetical protein